MQKIFNFFEKQIYLSIPTLITIVVLVVFIRWLGILEPLELATLNNLFRLRNPEPISPRTVVVGITAEDVQKLATYPLTDAKLAELLDKIRQQKPRAIGLDLYRDLPVPSQEDPGYPKLINLFETTPNLVGITNLGEGQNPRIERPPGLKYLACNVVTVDRDRILRRAVLYPSGIQENKIPSLGLMLAFLYLEREKNIELKWVEDNDNYILQFGSVKLKRFSSNDGGYVRAEDTGYQMLLNYRSPPKNFPEFNITEVLDGTIPPDSFRDKIVLVGNIDYSAKDIFYTPYTPQLPKSVITSDRESNDINDKKDGNVYGVYIQANIASSIVSAVLEERPLIKVLSQWQEVCLIVFFAAVPLILVRIFERILFKKINIQKWYVVSGFYLLAISISVVVVIAASLITINAFRLNALWLPIAPIILGNFISFLFIIRDPDIFKIEQQNYNLNKLNQNLEEAKQALQYNNSELETTKQALEATNQKLAETNKKLDTKIRARTKELQNAVEILQETQKKLVFENQALKEIEDPHAKYYHLGGKVPHDSPSYVIRYADVCISKALREGEYSYVFNARTMGKSSLLARAMKELKSKGIKCAEVDMSRICSPNLTVEQWYLAMVDRLAYKLKLLDKIDYKKWWDKYEYFTPFQRFDKFFQEVILNELDAKITIFFDEIDSVLNLNFNVDDFFILIRSFYNARPSSPEFERLNFVFLGVASPFSLIKNKQRTPFNIGRAIILEPFELYQVKPLIEGLANKCFNPQNILKEILLWTGGQPFLTQKLCLLISEFSEYISEGQEKFIVENIVKKEILENWEFKDRPQHLRTIADRILSPQSSTKELLELYQQLLHEREITLSESSSLHMELLLTGLVYRKEGKIKLYNLIYETIFDREWVVSQLEKLKSSSRSPY